MSTTLLRLLVAGWIVILLARAARNAWDQRRLVLEVWRGITWRHVLGSLGLVVVVILVATILLETVPLLGYGLGSLVGFQGNAVFAPLEEAVARAGPAPQSGPDWLLIAISTGFLGLLGALLPWLAFVEEEVFRAGLERASTGRQLRAALWFGLVHLIMLVPLAAALAIAVAGFVYGRLYRRAFARADGAAVPAPVARAFRPTRRSASAAAAARRELAAAHAADPAAVEIDVRDRQPERRQAEATLASAVWHTTFNTMVVLLVWIGIVWSAFAGAGAP